MVSLAFGVVAAAMAQGVPEGWREYTIRRGDCLTMIAVRIPGVNRNNFLWAAEKIATVNGIQSPDHILAWKTLYIPESVDLLRKAGEANLVILREKRAAPPIVFHQKSKTAPSSTVAILDGIKEKVEELTKGVQVGFSNLAKVGELKKELATATKHYNELATVLTETGKKLEILKKEKEKALDTVVGLKEKLSEKEANNNWLWKNLVIPLISVAVLVVVVLVSVGLANRRLSNERKETEKTNLDLARKLAYSEQKKNELQKEVDILQAKLEEFKEIPAREVLQDKVEKFQKRLDTLRELSIGRKFKIKGEEFEVVGGKFPEEVFDINKVFTKDEIAKRVGVRVKHLACGTEVDYVSMQAHLQKCEQNKQEKI